MEKLVIHNNDNTTMHSLVCARCGTKFESSVELDYCQNCTDEDFEPVWITEARQDIRENR